MVVSSFPLRSCAVAGVARPPRLVPSSLEGEVDTRLRRGVACRPRAKLEVEVVDTKPTKFCRRSRLTVPVPGPVFFQEGCPRTLVLETHLFARVAAPAATLPRVPLTSPYAENGPCRSGTVARAEAARVTTPACLEGTCRPAMANDGGSEGGARASTHGPVIGTGHA